MSLRSDLFTAIYNALIAIDDINTVELYNSQFDNESTERPHKYPFCAIEFSDMQWTETQQATGGQYANVTNQQKGLWIITIHIAFQSLKDETASWSDIYPVVDNVYYALNMLDGNTFGAMKRTSEEQDIDHDGVIVWKMNFTCPVMECGIEDDKEDATDGGSTEITLEIQKDLDIDNIIIRTGDGE
jgi:hypothetical protein